MKQKHLENSPPPKFPDAERSFKLLKVWVELWHKNKDHRSRSLFLETLREQHRSNFDLWHEEDKARDPNADDAVIAAVKRRIDKLNQKRNDLIECLDEVLRRSLSAADVRPAKDAPWNTETPGAVFDRLSIAALRIFHMREQTVRRDASVKHRKNCVKKLNFLTRQRKDLELALKELLDDLAVGRKQLKLYKQHKMYNDPTLNPTLYRAKNIRHDENRKRTVSRA